MPFALDSNPDISEISDAVNYLLANFGPNMAADPVTGQITGPSGIVIAYLYKYLAIKYSDSADGSVNFSNSPTNRLYYGARNTDDSVESTNPADYIWNKVSGGFGTTKFLYYQTTGGRQVDIAIATTNPTSNYVEESGTAIDLDILTSGRGRQVAYPSIYQWTATITPPSRPSTTTTFTWSTGTYAAPSGWTSTPLTDTVPGHYLWAITVPLSASPNDLTSVCDWTNTSYAIYNISSNGSTGSNGLNFLNAYLVQSQASPAPTFTATTSGATIPSGWTGTAPSVAVGQVLWYIQGQYNSSGITINGVAANTTAWTGPIAASIFQDIRSDNWNGSTPPTSSNIATWGTTGYYISRTDGNMYANGFYARGVMQVNGAVYNPGIGYTTALDANSSSGSSIGVLGFSNTTAGYGVVGYTTSASTFAGVNGSSSQNGSVGVIANNTGGGIALNVAGKMAITNNTLVTNLNADLLDGQHAAAFVNVASGTTNGKYFYYVNNTGAPANPVTRAAWILMSTNDGGLVYVPGYL